MIGKLLFLQAGTGNRGKYLSLLSSLLLRYNSRQLPFMDESEKFSVKFSDDLRRYIALFRVSRSLVITVSYNEEVNMKLCLNIFLDISPFPLL